MANTISSNSSLLANLSNLRQNSDRINLQQARISSSERITSAKDDAAGLAISNRLDARTEGFNQAIRNASDAVSLTEVASGGLGQVTEGLQRIQELATQAANGSLNDQDRATLQAEAQQQLEAINDVVSQTRFNGSQPLARSEELNFQLGPDAGDRVRTDTPDIAATLEGLSTINLSSQQGASAALELASDAQDQVGAAQAQFGALANRFESAIDQLSGQSITTQESSSRIRDTDIAASTAELTKERIQNEVSLAVIAQGNSDAENTLRLLL